MRKHRHASDENTKLGAPSIVSVFDTRGAESDEPRDVVLVHELDKELVGVREGCVRRVERASADDGTERGEHGVDARRKRLREGGSVCELAFDDGHIWVCGDVLR